MPSFKSIRLSRNGPVAVITLSRSRTGNRLDRRVAEELSLASFYVNQDDALRAIVLTGSSAVFSAGWELPRSLASGSPDVPRSAAAIAAIQKPVVAAINGDAIGQGLELALAADIRIAVTTARFAMPHVHHGLLPWDGGTQRLSRTVGRAHALELLLTGEHIDAATALRMGIVHQVAPPEELDRAVQSVTERIVAGAPIALRYAKETVYKGMDLTLDQGLHLEADLNMLLLHTKDRAEGIRSFLERRTPVFQGE
ncbi:MAG: enoyl-CoA hydratase/isomerase family protein [Chloroflexi bacterium]|nr:enoyl-CoA hydratase/isomerase family protein [Chloroflexota bacterium]